MEARISAERRMQSEVKHGFWTREDETSSARYPFNPHANAYLLGLVCGRRRVRSTDARRRRRSRRGAGHGRRLSRSALAGVELVLGTGEEANEDRGQEEEEEDKDQEELAECIQWLLHDGGDSLGE
jgi:hypothetical protein